MTHHVKVTPLKVRREHPLLSVEALHVVGYRAECSCGWRGKVRGAVWSAQVDRSEHRLRIQV